MYITLQSVDRKVGFKGVEATDLIVGLPLFFILLLMFSFSQLRIISIILFVISAFMFIPVTLSKKNRMYKIIYLVFSFFIKNKVFLYNKEGDVDEK